MENKKLLNDIRLLAEKGQISKRDVVNAFEDGAKTGSGFLRKLDAAKILYFLGGGIVALGIAILISQNWDSLNTAARILATLGASAAAYLTGYLLCRISKFDAVGQAFYFISALTLPFGMYIIFDSFGAVPETMSNQSLIYGIIAAVQLLSYYKFKKIIFLLFSLVYSAIFYSSIIFLITVENPLFKDIEFYTVFFIGISVMLLGQSFSVSKIKFLSGPLYAVGAFVVLTNAFALTGGPGNFNMFWETLFPFLSLGIALLSIYTKNKVLLPIGAIFLVIYIFKITIEHFPDSLGWPLALVISGLFLIFVGVFSVYMNKRFLK